VETCQKLSIKPSEYLKEVLDAQQSEAFDWTPACWPAVQKQSA
jgi:hypothetical protein